mgnify:CR=1 FL=1
MFKVALTGPNRLDIELSGKLDRDEMKTALDELQQKSKNIDRGIMLYDVIDFSFPSAGAIFLEFTRMPAMLRVMRKFHRSAVLTDQSWLKSMSEFQNALMPGMEIKAFDRDQRKQAVAWLID